MKTVKTPKAVATYLHCFGMESGAGVAVKAISKMLNDVGMLRGQHPVDGLSDDAQAVLAAVSEAMHQTQRAMHDHTFEALEEIVPDLNADDDYQVKVNCDGGPLELNIKFNS